MKMRHIPYGEGIADDFERALTENAIAKERFEALPREAQEKLRRRAEQTRSFGELKAVIDAFVGWQTGHGPYQQ